MPKFRKLPVEIEAIQFDGYQKTAIAIRDQLGAVTRISLRGNDFHDVLVNLYITTLEGELHVSEDDWVIKGVAGECYPCKPDIFQQTYEPA